MNDVWSFEGDSYTKGNADPKEKKNKKLKN